MSDFKFSCPRCTQHLQCDSRLGGREIQCPNCNHLIRIPPAPGMTSEYTPESGKTWATYAPRGDVPAPQGLAIRKEKPPEPPAK